MKRGHRRAAFLVVGIVAALLLACFLRAGKDASRHPGRSTSGGPARVPLSMTGSFAMAPEGEALRISGVVRDAQGPVAGVQVSASRVDADTLSERPCPKTQPDHRHSAQRMRQENCCFQEVASEYARRVDAREGEAPVLAQTVTADDGTFVLDGLSPGAVTLWALGDSSAAVQPDIAAGSDAVMLTLEERVFFSGTVVEELTRIPIPDARVTLIHEAGSRYFDALADDQGRFRVGPLPPGRYLRVASAQGWRTKAFREDVWLDADVDVTLELQRKARLEGRVLTPEGLPASGMSVHLRLAEEADDTSTAQSDAQGRFVFEEVPALPHLLWARTEQEAAYGDAKVTPPEYVVLQMRPFGFMEGTVRDEQQRPLAGVRLRANGPRSDGQPPPEALTDAAGHYRLGPLLDPSVNLLLRREHYRDQRQRVRLGGAHEGPWDFTLARAMPVEGQVVDTGGMPLAGAQVKLVMKKDAPEWRWGPAIPAEQAAESNEAGHFTVDGRASATGLLFVTARGFLDLELPVEVPSTGVRVVMNRGASVSGTVMDATGRPLSDVDLRLWNTAPQSGDARTTAVNTQGAFTLDGLEAGHYVLEARRRTPGIEHTASRPVDLEERQQATVSVRFDEGRTLQGTAVDTDGYPLPGVRIQACLLLEDIPAWQGRAPDCTVRGEGGVLSGPDGRFTFKHLTAPAYQLIAWKQGHAFAPSRSRGGTPDAAALLVATGQEDVRLVLERRPHLRGRVVSDDGAPLPCDIWEWDLGMLHAPAGAFDLPLPEDGPRSITVCAKGFFNLQREFVVSPGRDIDLGTLRMSRGRKVRFTVLNKTTRAPMAGISVDIIPTADAPLRGPLPHPFHSGRLDAEGGAEMEGLPFEAISFFVSLNRESSDEGTNVLLDATQETVTVLLTDPDG
ncbi:MULTISPECIES: carboxypeptidase-like regulatory domain-containing protein [Corallococcus]|uniref:carboxypeptidase-like regulatory domain-containing protein n=1 Tax=Corallococcus TaxID=83461 RepID=UPI001180C73F|nr:MULTISPECIES: carboxypeptidase-like regulatory domain-containing protein [Corallococcus]NBD08440.1 carboxypeptidase regulatory-like domain-containing protein [Corallococcus silvisoli]TSC34385.1 carboxypeptidase regulatory-like domain-containing protein [Corallococcus sp. Z5C101001]